MIKTKTVFVVGAGASQEAGLPVGNGLKILISQLMEHALSDMPNSDEQETKKALGLAGESYTPEEAKAAINTIRSSLPLAKSIDNFLDAHSGNKLIESCGKIGIVSAIIDAERRSLFAPDILNFSALEGTWYGQLWQSLMDGVQTTNVPEAFKDVVFVVFNYDRCLERFLFEAMRTYHNIDKHEAWKVLCKIRIYHPYGTVGQIESAEHAALGFHQNNPDASTLNRLAGQIKTFTERKEEGEELQRMRADVRSASKLVFLGFGFLPMNMELLLPEGEIANEKESPPTVFATALDDSPFNVARYMRDLSMKLTGQPASTLLSSFHYQLNGPNLLVYVENCRCGPFFERFSAAFRS